METAQEQKYKIEDGKIVNRLTGQAIPDDEPVFILRAQDARAEVAMRAYSLQCRNSEHADAVRARHEAFRKFAREHPERMKEPDTNPAPNPS